MALRCENKNAFAEKSYSIRYQVLARRWATPCTCAQIPSLDAGRVHTLNTRTGTRVLVSYILVNAIENSLAATT